MNSLERQQEEQASRTQSAALLVVRVLGRYAPGGNQHPYTESQMRQVDRLLRPLPRPPLGPPVRLLRY